MRALTGIVLMSTLTLACQGQGLFERFKNRPEATTALVLGYRGQFEFRGFGSGALYFVPLDTNAQNRLVAVVTAKHNLADKETGVPFDGLLIKVNAARGRKPLYVKLPLKHDEPRNYWISPSGFDFAVIPLPPQLVSGADVVSFSEDQIVTPENSDDLQITPGLIVQALCMQPEYMDALDFLMPETLPALRIGHLSRLGFYRTPDGARLVRPHVIDMHSSPGNSGATVLVLVPKPDQSLTQPMFLGIVQGFPEETGSYIPYKAPLTNLTSESTSMLLVSAERAETNQVALTFKTVANPDLTTVIPVHELVGIRASPAFASAAFIMSTNQKLYETLDALPVPNKEDAQPAH
ncbi:MAG: hypothetical protein AB7T27_05260 [Kiritimatiellia bacterium]